MQCNIKESEKKNAGSLDQEAHPTLMMSILGQ